MSEGGEVRVAGEGGRAKEGLKSDGVRPRGGSAGGGGVSWRAVMVREGEAVQDEGVEGV